MGQVFKFWIRLDKTYFLGEVAHVLLFDHEREREMGEEKSKTSFDDPRSSVGQNSSRQ